MQTRANIVYNAKNKPMYVSCINWIIKEEEGRRALMMEQEEQGVKDVNARGMIDLTTFSPDPSLSTATSGYSSCDDDQVRSPDCGTDDSCSSPGCQVVIKDRGGCVDTADTDSPCCSTSAASAADIVKVLPSVGNVLDDFDLTVFSDLAAGGKLDGADMVSGLLSSKTSGTQWNPELDAGVEMMDTDDVTAAAAGIPRLPANRKLTASVTMSLSELPSAGYTGEEMTDELAFKYVDSQMNESLFRYLGDLGDNLTGECSLETNLLNDVNMCTTAPAMPPPSTQHSYQSAASMGGLPRLCSSPERPPAVTAAALRGLDDHSYTSRSGPSRSHSSTTSASTSSHNHHHHHRNHHHPSHANDVSNGGSSGGGGGGGKACGSMLEHILTTKAPINPQKGSDYIIAHEAMSALNITDRNSPLLKKLLTGELDKRHILQQHRCSPTSTVSSSALSFTDNDLSLDSPELDLDLLADATPDIDKLWARSMPTSASSAAAVSSLQLTMVE